MRAMRPERYLTRPAQFSQVYRKGGSWANRLLVLKALPNGLELSRYGISVSRRVGGAVVRNRTKRRIREILRLASLRPGWDLLFIVRPAAAGTPYAGLEKGVKELLSRAHVLMEKHEELGVRTH